MPVGTTDPWTIAVIVGLAVITVVTRSFFFISSRPLPLPRWIERGLAYAPIAALAAVVIPEISMAQGGTFASWRDARVWGAAFGIAAFYWRRDVLVTMVVGMAVYLPLRLGLGW